MAEKKISRVFCVINSSAGVGKSGKLANEVRRQAELIRKRRGISIAIEENGKISGHRAAELIGKYIQEKHDLSVSIGGDGTLHGVVNSGMVKDIPLMPVKGGVGNDFARSFGIPDGVDWVFDLLNNQEKIRIVPVDIITLEYKDESGLWQKRICLNILTFGIDAQINAKAVAWKEKSRTKNSLGLFFVRLSTPGIYFAVGVKELLFNPKLEYLEFKTNTDDFEQLTMFAIANGSQYGRGLTIAPQGKPKYSLKEVIISALADRLKGNKKTFSYEYLQDGKAAVCKVRKASRLRLLVDIWKLFWGTHLSCPEVETCPDKTLPTCSHLRVFSKKPCTCQLDGEVLYLPAGEYLIAVQKQALRIVVPAP